MAESGTRTQLINLEGLNTFLNESKKIFEPTLPSGVDGQVLKLSGGKPTWGTDNTPTTFNWTGGTTAGPTGSLTGNGMSAVAFPAVPSASESASGVVTTGNQTFEGTKTFNKTIAGSITGNAGTASSLYGLSKQSSQTWGIQTGTFVHGEGVDGCDWGFRKDCPNSGAMSLVIDGKFYQDEGQYACIDTSGGTITGNLGVNGKLNAGSVQVNSKVTLQYNSSTESLDFVFA